MLAHWQLKAALRGQPPPYDAAQLAGEVEMLGGTLQGVSTG